MLSPGQAEPLNWASDPPHRLPARATELQCSFAGPLSPASVLQGVTGLGPQGGWEDNPIGCRKQGFRTPSRTPGLMCSNPGTPAPQRPPVLLTLPRARPGCAGSFRHPSPPSAWQRSCPSTSRQAHPETPQVLPLHSPAQHPLLVGQDSLALLGAMPFLHEASGPHLSMRGAIHHRTAKSTPWASHSRPPWPR